MATLNALFTWLKTQLPSNRKTRKEENFLTDLVFFSSEEELAEYLQSFRDEE